MGRFNKGLFFGGMLGASLVWLTVTKKGRELREQIFDHAAVVYAEFKGKLMESDAWKNMTENEYVNALTEILDRYVIKTGLAKEVRDIVERIVRTQWKHMRAELEKERN